MIQPRVLCVMLANGRPEMVERAVRSFRAQAYPEKELLIRDSAVPSIWDSAIPSDWMSVPASVYYVEGAALPIGTMRNAANRLFEACPLIAHWDSDDFSHPDRLMEQVRLIQQTGADCVGYNEMLFWKTPTGDPSEAIWCACGNSYNRHMATVCPRCAAWPDRHRGEAWLYTNPNLAYCIGTSLLYTRAIWQRFPFPDCHVGEDTRWLLEKRIRRVAVSANATTAAAWITRNYHEPRMIASIHGGNTSSAIQPGAREWKRAAEFDSYCRETMKL